MAQMIIADMDSWKRAAVDVDSEGAFSILVVDKTGNSLLAQILDQLKIVNARLNAGIKVQTLGLGITVPAVVTL